MLINIKLKKKLGRLASPMQLFLFTVSRPPEQPHLSKVYDIMPEIQEFLVPFFSSRGLYVAVKNKNYIINICVMRGFAACIIINQRLG